MSEDTTGERTLEQRVAALERIFQLIAERQGQTLQLADATQDLASSVSGVERVLTSVDEAMRDAREAKASAHRAQDTADSSIVELARSEHRYRRHTRFMALLAVLISIAAAVGIAWWAIVRFDRINHDQAVIRYHQCLSRNEQAAEQAARTQAGLIYSIELFGAVKQTDPALARAIEAIPRPSQQPAPTVVRCVKP